MLAPIQTTSASSLNCERFGMDGLLLRRETKDGEGKEYR
jgi:hypothetical protein